MSTISPDPVTWTPSPFRLNDPLIVGGVTIRNRVVLAPMSGVSDRPFRNLADRFGAGMVVSEMIASEQLSNADPEAVLKTERAGNGPFVIQLAGREACWMAEGARIAEAHGADIVDINMGCPARKVTGGSSGSALMRDLSHALTLIEAVVSSVKVPVSLKMRLGWDDDSLNAPELACRAENAGVQMLTVHGRTRCQFFKGQANWRAIANVKQAVRIPVIANGDVTSLDEIREALALSHADAIMIGRGAYGAPWAPGSAANDNTDIETQNIQAPPSGLANLVEEHFEAMLRHYGAYLGLRNARKHLGWYVARVHGETNAAQNWRTRLCRGDDPKSVRRDIRRCFGDARQDAA
ncbi:MAG: tRNA dihydrouridine synthase DusB [Hyphomicrobiaceae bacterium]